MGYRIVFKRVLWPDVSKLTGSGALRIVIALLFVAIARNLFGAGDWVFGVFWLIFLVPIPIFGLEHKQQLAALPPFGRGVVGRIRLAGPPVRSPIRGLECAAAEALSPVPG